MKFSSAMKPLEPTPDSAHRLGLGQQTSWCLFASFSLFSGPECTVGSYCTGRSVVPIVPIEDSMHRLGLASSERGGGVTPLKV